MVEADQPQEGTITVVCPGILAYQFCVSVGTASVVAEEGVILVLIRVFLASHEEHVLQVVTEALEHSPAGRMSYHYLCSCTGSYALQVSSTRQLHC